MYNKCVMSDRTLILDKLKLKLTNSKFTKNLRKHYSGPCDLRPLYFTIPCILRPDISDTTCIFSV